MLIFKNINRNAASSSLSEILMLIIITLMTIFQSQLNFFRDYSVVFYSLILLYCATQLQYQSYVRCGMYAFLTFVGLKIWEAHHHLLGDYINLELDFFMLIVMLLYFKHYSNLEALHQRTQTLELQNKYLLNRISQLEQLTAMDDLTGVFNRRQFLHLAEEYLSQGDQHGFAMIDLDFFKRVNDAHGHSTGDQVIKILARVARNCLGTNDIVGRYGGEEFVLFLPKCDVARLTECCERLRNAFAQYDFNGLSCGHLTVSIGMTLCKSEPVVVVLERADKALYRAKKNGRNRCEAKWD